uniref:Putative ubiquitin-like protein 7 n=1 Tax=Corethrella appendiculata TaxID=1370023 RepID=U5ES39_9DIPT
MSYLYLGVKFPSKPYEKVLIENYEKFETVEKLKLEANKSLDVSLDEIEFIYCGNILPNETRIKDHNLRVGSVIHVVKKATIPQMPTYERFTEANVQEVVYLFRSVHSSNFQRVKLKEVIKHVLETHPHLRKDLWSLSVLRDPILLASLQNPDTVRLVAENHRVLIEAAKTIVDSLNSKSLNKFDSTLPAEGMDDNSDSSSSSDNNAPASSSTSRERHTTRRITTEQLSHALRAYNGSSSFNSLANISQRNLSNVQSGDTQASSSSGTARSTQPPRITSSTFMNALSEVLLQTRRSRPEESTTSVSSNNTSSNNEPVAPSTNNEQQTPLVRYQAELNQMRELGLNDTQVNLQALEICNGDVEAAINLVFSETNN